MSGDRSRVKADRIRVVASGSPGSGPVIYWMNRDQRVKDNWALIYAQDVALAANRPLEVVFCLGDSPPDSSPRSYYFMLSGLNETAEAAIAAGISFTVLRGEPVTSLATYLSKKDPAMLIADFSPLRSHRTWLKSVKKICSCPVYQVDAHNVVPCWEASDKREYAARTIRPKIHRKLSIFMDAFPSLLHHPYGPAIKEIIPETQELSLDNAALSIRDIVPGTQTAENRLKDFLDLKLSTYHLDRNDPNLRGTSGLSPYLNSGQLAPQRALMEAFASDKAGADSFIEEALVRRELAENYCYYEPDYDEYSALPQWARKTLDSHRNDPRPWIYDLETLRTAQTHDDLWNAAQRSLLNTGTIHGYLRMYWGKMLLLWSPSPEEAFLRGLYLNDRYAIDGCDPNGYVGVAWCIGGLHDRPWPGRPVFGSVRSMALSGCMRKFDVKRYVETMS